MRRREVITLLGGVAAGWPFATRAQQTSNPPQQKVYRVGFLFAGTIAPASAMMMVDPWYTEETTC